MINQYEVKIHKNFLATPQTPDPDFDDFLSSRRRKLLNNIGDYTSDELKAWELRTYPVIGILAPVMSTNEDKIEFPGDPMCLYSALSFSVKQVVKAREKGINSESPYNDLCPQLGILPSMEYRFSVNSHGFRDYSSSMLNTDQIIFDPRVWNKEVKDYFIENVLLTILPKVVLISTVSPGFRYAIEIAKTIKDNLPDTIVIIGGRHIDETLSFNFANNELISAFSSVLSCIDDGRIERVFDFVVAGEGYFALDAILKAVSISFQIETKTLIDKKHVFDNIDNISKKLGQVIGQALIIGIEEKQFHVWPINGPKFDLGNIPSPYDAFAIRARFPVFTNETGSISRTAHMMVTNSCPYHCNFCSEGSTVAGPMIQFDVDAVQKAISRVVDFVRYGAEAIFFDDSIFWGGNIKRMEAFCEYLILLKKQVLTGERILANYSNSDKKRLLNLKWAGQFTVDILVSILHEANSLKILETMKKAGCTYIYIGIESMSTAVAKHIHKNVNKNTLWKDRVRKALEIVGKANIQVGSSVLFGLEGETQETIEETISEIEILIKEELLYVASPNILTYHPGTAITYLHKMQDKIDYHSAITENRPPYIYFEEAFPSVVSTKLTEDEIWYIHDQTKKRWGSTRNSNTMPPLPI